MPKYRKSLSSGGKQITSTANTLIKFTQSSDDQVQVPFFSIESFDKKISFKLNDESTVHVLDEGETMTFEDMLSISKVIILESGVEYKWLAFY